MKKKNRNLNCLYYCFYVAQKFTPEPNNIYVDYFAFGTR